jgi:hypothetical protein
MGGSDGTAGAPEQKAPEHGGASVGNGEGLAGPVPARPTRASRSTTAASDVRACVRPLQPARADAGAIAASATNARSAVVANRLDRIEVDV